MGKIGDLWVRLGLKKDEYDKGIKDAEKKGTSFGSKLKNVSTMAVAAWAAIGTAVIAVGQNILEASNVLGDKFNMATQKAKAAWDTFKASLTAWDWDDFGDRMTRAMDAREALVAAQDAEFEVMNSVKLQRAMYAEELAQLEIDMRDMNKSYDERIAAAEKYLSKIKSIYEQELNLRKDLMTATTADWLAQTGFKDYMDPELHKAVQQFLIDYGKDAELASALAAYNASDTNKADWEKANAFIWDYINRTGNKWVTELARVYEESRGDATNQALVDAIEAYYNQAAAMKRDTKRIETLLNSNRAQRDKAISAMESDTTVEDLSALQAIERTIEGMATTTASMPDIIPDDWMTRNRQKIDEAVMMMMKLQDAAYILNDGLNAGLASGLDTLAQAIAGVEGVDAGSVIQALLTPLADAAVQAGMIIVAQGTAVEAFKKALTSLNGYAALAAGAALIAVGVAAKAGLAAIGNRGSAAGATSTYASSGSYGTGTETISSELTVYVKGRISGRDIIISGDRTMAAWGR